MVLNVHQLDYVWYIILRKHGHKEQIPDGVNC